MSRSESAAPRRGRDASDDPADTLDETVVPAARHAMEESTRPGRRTRLGVGLAVAALTLGSVGVFAVRGSDSGLETTVAAQPSQTTSTSVAARVTEQVNRSTTRSALPSASGLSSAELVSADQGLASAASSSTPAAQTPAASKTAASKTTTATPQATTATSKTTPTIKAAPQWPDVLWKQAGTRYATSNLNIRTTPTESATVITVAAPGTALKVTAAVHGSYRQVNWNGKVAWVSKAYLATEKSVAKTSAGSGSSGSGSSGSGSSGSGSGSGGVTSGSCSKSMPAGVISSGRAAALEACTRFPAITSFGGYRAGDSGEHGSGHAVDIMISGQVGWAVAEWARANASRLGISEVIYQQKIWTTQRSGEGWRPMSNRGSATANHYDHVHITLR